MKNYILLVLTLFVSSSGFASTEQFEKMKTLVGKWEGVHKDKDGKEEKIPLTYELSSGGTVLIEKIGEGDSHEMTTMYHMDGDQLIMTHYCMVGNQPTMKVKKSDTNSLSFDFVSATNMKSKKDPHMHSLVVTIPNNNELKQDWTFYKDGKKDNTETFSYKRVN